MKTLTIKVPDQMFAEITSMAQTRNVSKSEIVRERLSEKNESDQLKKPSLWSQMEDVVISEDSLPVDLSSNNTHLKGYGKKRPH